MLRPSATPSAVRRALDPVAALGADRALRRAAGRRAGRGGERHGEPLVRPRARSLCRAGEDGRRAVRRSSTASSTLLDAGDQAQLVSKRRWGEVVGDHRTA